LLVNAIPYIPGLEESHFSGFSLEFRRTRMLHTKVTLSKNLRLLLS
jgi:hypothetical protein